MKSIIFVLCLIFLIVPEETGAINCYTCASGTDGCGSSFKKTGSGVVITASSSASFCTTWVYTSNKNSIQRGYSTSDTCIDGDYTTDDFTYHLYCCAKNLCNEASIGRITSILLIITTLIGLLLIK